MNADSAPATVVLVHGGFVDGSGWRPVYDLLSRDGYPVAVVQNPALSLPGDAAAARLIIDAQDGPVVLVGHSYGGAVISEAGTHPDVAALVYISAFAPDKDESVNTLIGGFPASGPQPPILPPRDGFLFLDRDQFHAAFAADLPAGLAAFMADAQVPWSADAAAGQVTDAAWRTRPSWYLVTTEDRMIPPPAQRTMAPAGRLGRRGGGGQPRQLHIPPGRGSRPHQAGRHRRDRPAVTPPGLISRPVTRGVAGLPAPGHAPRAAGPGDTSERSRKRALTVSSISIGTGTMARILGALAVEGGNAVEVTGRDPAKPVPGRGPEHNQRTVAVLADGLRCRGNRPSRTR